MKILPIQILTLLFLTTSCAWAQSVRIHFDAYDPQASYAAQRLEAVLKEQNFAIVGTTDLSEYRIKLATKSGDLSTGAFIIGAGENSLTVTGGDGRGLIYGALALAEQLRNGKDLESIQSQREAPALAFRAIKHNLPWDSYRSSSALDLHYDTVRNVKYWEAFLDMMAENRFNALTLWNLHPFPYMIMPKNFPEASPFTEAEMAEWRRLYQSIFAMARERGIDTYLVNWNVLVSREFAQAHDLEGTNYYPYYKGQADYKGEAQTSAVVKRYTRESVTQVLEE